MTIPAGNIRGIKTREAARLDDDVFQNFIDGMTDMNVAVGIGRPIVQDELGTSCGSFPDSVINLFVLPLLDPFGFPFGKITSHGKWCIGHVDRIFLAQFVFVLLFFTGLVRWFIRHFYHT